jgi:short-chain fatty acids transporter
LLCAMALGWLERDILNGVFALSFNNLNFAFLFLGLLFQGNPIRYVRAVSDGARGCAGIILQFPLYFGILGIMVVTGLGAVVSSGMASLANETTYPIVTYFSAGLVNLFVPSGGGQWVVQGKIILDGCAAWPELFPKAVMALTYGDALTNMLQPFWAVPLLAITGLRARDIIGYTATVMILGGALTTVLLLIL